jgi:ribosome-associated protein
LYSLSENKADETVTIPLHGKSSIADYMVIASGRSSRQVQSIAENLLKDLRKEGYRHCIIEGLENGDWVVVDTGDVIVHVFRPEVRQYYALEKMWSLATQNAH